MDKDQLIANVKKFLKEKEGFDVDGSKVSGIDLIDKFLIPALRSSKDSLTALYDYFPKKRSGLLGKIKNKIEILVSNMVKSNLEKQSLRQQKFNDVVVQILEILTEIEKKKLEENK